eukprot:COSAG06_NODE_1283_length_10013_cov_81.204156_9_plen_63_part_00
MTWLGRRRRRCTGLRTEYACACTEYCNINFAYTPGLHHNLRNHFATCFTLSNLPTTPRNFSW